MKRIIIFAAMAAMVFASCNKNAVEDLTSYYKVFSGSNTSLIGFGEGMTNDISVYAKTTDAGVPEDLTVTFKSDESLVATFNKTAAEPAKLLPAKAWSFSKPTASIKGMYRKSDNAVVTLKYDATLEPSTSYVLPITIAQVEGSAKAHVADSSVVFISVKTSAGDIGKGTKDNPYRISTVEDMLTIETLLKAAASDNDPGVFFKIMKNIDMKDAAWLPINRAEPYKQKVDFNGNGMTISNLNAPLFGCVVGNVYDLTIDNSAVTAFQYNGLLGINSGIADMRAVITNVRAKGLVDGTGNGIGGIIGIASNSVISRCHADVVVKGASRWIGGVVGCIQAGTTVENCISVGTVDAPSNSQRVGGVVGQIHDNAKNVVKNCICTATVKSNMCGAGVVGHANNNASSAQTDVNATVSGCIAWNNDVTISAQAWNNYSSGCVVGYTCPTNTLSNCWRKANFILSINAQQTGDNYPLDYIKPADQEDASPSKPLTGIDCDYSAKQVLAYHGKAAAAGETASQVAKRIGWDEKVWDLSGAIPALK